MMRVASGITLNHNLYDKLFAWNLMLDIKRELRPNFKTQAAKTILGEFSVNSQWIAVQIVT